MTTNDVRTMTTNDVRSGPRRAKALAAGGVLSLVALSACSATPPQPTTASVTTPLLTTAPPSTTPPAESSVALSTTAEIDLGAPDSASDSTVPVTEPVRVVQKIYDGRLLSGWVDGGWSDHVLAKGEPAKVELGNGGGILLQGTPPPDATAIEFRFRPPRNLGAVVVVSLGSAEAQNVGRQVVLANNRPDAQGWNEVRIPLVQLNPSKAPFTAIRFSSIRKLPVPFVVEFDRVRLTSGGPLLAYGVPNLDLGTGSVRSTPAPVATSVAPSSSITEAVRRTTRKTPTTRATKTTRAATTRPGATTASTVTSSAALATAPPAAGTDLVMSVDCRAEVKRISPLIYGVGWSGASNQTSNPPWELSPTANRWGGNPTTRYNWQLGNVWNTASDYFFRNVTVNDAPNAMDAFLGANDAHSVASAVSVPALGWVAKDATSYSYPVKDFGRQQYTDPDNPDTGNGVSTSGKRIAPGSPKRTSVESTPASIGEWVRTKLKGRVTTYFVDNEPELWDSTHVDVHPEAVGYEEILDKTIQYSTAIHQNDPGAIVAAPSSWGWTAYNYSGIDAKAGFDKAPDRRAHGDMPFLAWYLQQVRQYEEKNKVKLLDLLDVHYYPQANGVFTNGNDKSDPALDALRIRQVRGLWDRTYTDESWIGEPVYLIPRLREWIDKYAPGVGISIGEWNFGGESFMSGGLATAEALGRFGTEGVTSAYYWTNPPANSPSFWAFRAYRNFDGKGGHFGDYSVGATVAGGNGVNEKVSLFASRNVNGNEVELVVLNTDPSRARNADLTLSGCGSMGTFETFRYSGGSAGFSAASPVAAQRDGMVLALPPYSITVVRARTR